MLSSSVLRALSSPDRQLLNRSTHGCASVERICRKCRRQGQQVSVRPAPPDQLDACGQALRGADGQRDRRMAKVEPHQPGQRHHGARILGFG
jgi:hypothetical protein